MRCSAAITAFFLLFALMVRVFFSNDVDHFPSADFDSLGNVIFDAAIFHILYLCKAMFFGRLTGVPAYYLLMQTLMIFIPKVHLRGHHWVVASGIVGNATVATGEVTHLGFPTADVRCESWMKMIGYRSHSPQNRVLLR